MDLVDWCNKDIDTLYRLAMDRTKWTHFVKYVINTNGHKRERERDDTQSCQNNLRQNQTCETEHSQAF